MSPKAIGIILLAMSGSFVTILAILGSIVASDGPSRPSRRTANSAIVAPPVPSIRSHPDTRTDTRTSVAKGASQARRSQDGRPQAEIAPATLDVPDRPQPLSGAAVTLPPPQKPAEELADLAKVTEKRLQGVEQALSQQIATLKQSRDEMLDELAGQLAVDPLADATAAVSALDDETAALTLKRLGSARRAAILRALPPKRRAALEQRLKRASGS